MINLSNKKILLVICGGISAYKSLEIIRGLKKSFENLFETYKVVNKLKKEYKKLRMKKYDNVLKKHVWFVEKKMPPHSK